MMRHDRSLVCLITDRRRLLADSDSPRASLVALVDQAREASDAGVDIIQIRERDLEASVLAAVVCAVIDATRGSATRVVVNDRLDVAIGCGAAGVHLRFDSVAPSAARSIAPSGFLIGRSVHGLEEAVEVAQDVDYLIAGTVFTTPSKPAASERLGLEGLGAIVRRIRVPVLAIGGVTLDTVHAIASTGAAGIAGIGLFLPGAAGMAEVVGRVRAAFERHQAAAP